MQLSIKAFLSFYTEGGLSTRLHIVERVGANRHYPYCYGYYKFLKLAKNTERAVSTGLSVKKAAFSLLRGALIVISFLS